MKYRNLVLRTFISGVIFSFFLAVSHAEVTLDGTLGPSGLISGPDYMISDDLGQLKGGNLFHSFGIFNAITGESATFTGPNSVENILGRVTGGSASIIDGCLSSQIPGANLFLMNPSGLMFGPNAFGGPGGNIQIVADNYLATPDSVVTVSSALGIDGEVVINAPATDVISGVEAVPAAFLDIASLLSSRCAARTEAAVGSFVKLGRGGVPPPPDGLRPSYYLDVMRMHRTQNLKIFLVGGQVDSNKSIIQIECQEKLAEQFFVLLVWIFVAQAIICTDCKFRLGISNLVIHHPGSRVLFYKLFLSPSLGISWD